MQVLENAASFKFAFTTFHNDLSLNLEHIQTNSEVQLKSAQ